MICGKICTGKTTYAEELKKENKYVLLSVDEIMIDIFGNFTGKKHDEYTDNVKIYLYKKSVELVNMGVNVILDWGFWTKQDRTFAKNFYSKNSIKCELHYINIRDNAWKERINQRNKLVSNNEIYAYFIDENLVSKFESLFDMPDKNEIDVWVDF